MSKKHKPKAGTEKRAKSEEGHPESLRERRQWSAEAWEEWASRRGQPLMVRTTEVDGARFEQLSLEQMLELRIDNTYQRPEVRPEVNELVAVLMNGGTIPEPILVSERPDGSRYIVDGQQRWLAHFDAQKPVNAVIIKVPNVAVEAKLFQVANNSTRLAAHHILRSWPGPAGRLLQRLGQHGALAGLLSWEPAASKSTFVSTAVARGLIACATGSTRGGRYQVMLQLLDRAYERNREWTVRAADTYAGVIARTFHGTGAWRCRPLPAVAMGVVCRTHWDKLRVGQSWPVPDDQQFKRLTKLHWDDLAESSAERFLPNVKAAIFAIWPTKEKS